MRYPSVVRPITGWLLWGILMMSWASAAAAENKPAEAVRISHRSFADFAQGTLGNSGANLYVSHKGSVQTINRWDLNRDGYLDLLFTQDHSDLDNPPALIYWGQADGYHSWLPPRWEERSLMSLWEFLASDRHQHIVTRLPAQGGGQAEIADLNVDGYPDIVFCNFIHNFRADQPVYIYWGSPEEYSPENRTELPAYLASGIASGDLNGDGFPELVVANYGDELGERYGLRYHLESYIYWGSAERYSTARRTALPTISARDVAIGDFNGDRSPDLAFINCNSKERSAYVYWGEAGQYSAENRQVFGADQVPAPTTSSINGRLTLVAARLNSDSYDDLIMAGGTQVLIYRGSAGGLVADQSISLATGGVTDLKAADCNADGLCDLVIANSGSPTSMILWGTEDGFEANNCTELPTLDAQSVSVADLNGDRRPDLLFGNYADAERYDVPCYIYWNGPQGFSAYRRTDLLGARVAGTAVDDLNGDGRPDILIVNHVSGPSGPRPALVFWGNADYRYSPAAMGVIENGGNMMYSAADLDDDGWPDVVFLGNRGAYICWGGQDGYTLERRTHLDIPGAISSRVADLNADGYLDILFTVSGNVPGGSKAVIVWGDEYRFAQLRTDEIHFLGPGTEASAIADLNRDGYLDLVFPCTGSAQSEIKWGSPDGYSEENRTLLAAYGSPVAQVADLDADGWLDLIFAGGLDTATQSHTTKTMIYWGAPEGFSERDCIELESYVTLDATVADFNRDGHLDLALSNYRSDTVRDLVAFIYWGGEGRSFNEKRRTTLNGGSSSSIKALDLNQDGWPELIIVNHKLNHDHAQGSANIYWGGPEGYTLNKRDSLPVFGNHLTTVVDAGNLYTREPIEEYVSAPIRAPAQTRFARLEWTVQSDPGTAVTFQVRSASDKNGLAQAAWTGPKGPGSFYETSGAELAEVLPEHRWLQYRAVFTSPSGGGSARLLEVTVECWK